MPKSSDLKMKRKAGTKPAYQQGDSKGDEIFHGRKPWDSILKNSRESIDKTSRDSQGTLAFNLAPGAGSLYRIDRDGNTLRAETGLTLPNGLGWSPDGAIMYLVETAKRVVYAYDFDEETGQIANRRNLITFPPDMPGSPDGLDVDADGNLGVAVWDGWCIQKYNPDSEPAAQFGTPFPRPASTSTAPHRAE